MSESSETNRAERIAFLGLGVMGKPMARHLLREGHQVVVFNRTQAKSVDFASTYGGEVAVSPGEAASKASVVFVCVGNDDHVRDVVLGEDGALASMTAGSVIVDHGTTSANLAREISDVALERGCGAVDAPVSGGQSGAEAGSLTVMAGGRAADFDRVVPLIRAYARHARLLGPPGSGQLAKMVNQICIAGVVQSLAEAINFAEVAGLDAVAVMETLMHGAAQSWQMEHRHASMIADSFDFGFAVEWMRKDLGLALEEARLNRAPLPLTALVDQFYADIQNMGGQRWDTSSLIKRLRVRS